MRQALLVLGLSGLMTGCQPEAEMKPGEVEAVITGNIIADYWTKGCSSGGLAVKVGKDSYVISNTVPAEYEDAKSWPLPVWVRYESAPPDSCSQLTNRITVLSIRKKE